MNAIAMLAAVVALDWTMPDGSVVSQTQELLPFDGGMRLVVSREQMISMKAKRLTVTPDFATATKGEDGYWVMPDNSFGTYRLDNGRVFQDWHVFMPMFGMKTPRTTYCAIVTGMPYSLGVEVRAKGGTYAQSAVFLADKDARFEAAPGERPVVKLADGAMFEGGTWKGVDFDLAGCKHFIFRRAWLDGCNMRRDGASECVIEYLDSPAPVPHQVFEIVNRREN